MKIPQQIKIAIKQSQKYAALSESNYRLVFNYLDKKGYRFNEEELFRLCCKCEGDIDEYIKYLESG